MEEYRSFESLERDGTAVLELDETVVEEEPAGTAEGLYFLLVEEALDRRWNGWCQTGLYCCNFLLKCGLH